MVKHVVTDAPEKRSPEGAFTTWSANDEQRVLFLRHWTNNFSWFSRHTFDLAANLKVQQNKFRL